jgi:hypothetical protein
MSKSNDIFERLADIQIGISVPGLGNPYVLQAEPYQPSDMSSVSCPFFVNELMSSPVPASIPISAGQQYRETRIAMLLAVARKEANINLKYGVQDTMQWADAVFAEFAKHVRLSAPSVLIGNSTNASPIKVTTVVPHRFTTGDPVTITGHAINTAANGAWIVTVVDDFNFTIPAVGIGVGNQTGSCRKTQPLDLGNVVDCMISEWNPCVLYEYGSTIFLALMFVLDVREMYVTTIEA